MKGTADRKQMTAGDDEILIDKKKEEVERQFDLLSSFVPLYLSVLAPLTWFPLSNSLVDYHRDCRVTRTYIGWTKTKTEKMRTSRVCLPVIHTHTHAYTCTAQQTMAARLFHLFRRPFFPCVFDQWARVYTRRKSELHTRALRFGSVLTASRLL